ncbi:redox-regulated ATPase YchF [Candidatus Woesearchaeota archaeon]|nr:redox-regulated ATPase YchF [Candidatus Woesearchaeota archaeon]
MLVGVVGKANVGKSTFFKAATLMDVEIANYPFATIKPNHGVGFIRVPCVDAELGVQCDPRTGFCRNHQRFVPIDMIDVAGLVPGAHEGKGMGLEFLNDLNQADCLIHVIDVSGGTSDKGEPVPPGTRDPAEDVRFLEDELDYWYLGILKKPWERFSKMVTQTHEDVAKALHRQFSGLGATEEMVVSLLKATGLAETRLSDWSDSRLFAFAKALRMKTKPMIVAANKIDVPGAAGNLARLQETFPDTVFVGCSSESELALKEADKHGLVSYLPGDGAFEVKGQPNEKQEKALAFIRGEVLGKQGSTGVQETLNRAVLDVLGYIAVWPGGVSKLADKDGNILPDVFMLKGGATALDFAYRVHTDIGKGFIRGIDVRSKRTVGKEHVLKHRDIIEIVSSK